ncbi:hypothetical protein LSTR_LSTR012860 [Laodelphax striatellus]|uniref:Ig-like domain-containing protein n=1 Tax=Laodelphax striatellus TaxID=195883 RepID=A0A482WHX1_LAOST|nr:hypothetical protein LSTR_LSTR012860 [Laodelphax striatellus]
MSVSPDRRSVRHGDEFIITCIAYGSQQITFRWLKNDILINVTKATREMSIIDSPNHLLDHFTSILTVKSADALDSGLYTCQAIDWGAQHCKSVKLDVIAAPSVKVAPLTASIQKGQALNIICTWSLMNDGTKSIYGYSWLKERKDTSEAHLFKMREESEVWEDLQPVGSILRVYNIQKSTRYTCQVQSNAEPVEASVDVEVLNKSAIPWCESDDTGLGGVRWAEIGAWGAAKVECPARYAGVATRLCSVSAPGRAVWLTPDYSDCISEDLSRLAENFKKLTLGYGSTTGAYTMSKIYELLRDRSRLYPGEGETYLTLMQDIAWYLNFTMAWKDLLQSTSTFYNTINVILQHSNSIINSQKLIDLQKLVNHWTIAWAKHSRINRASVQSYDSLMIHTYCFNSSSTKLEYTFDISGNIRGYQSWSRTAVNILVARESLVVHGSTYSIAIIIYKDLMKYLPERQIYKMDLWAQ